MTKEIVMHENDFLLSEIGEGQDLQLYRKLHWTGTYASYLGKVKENPKIVRSSFQYLVDMILSHGYEKYTEHREELIRYLFFGDPIGDGREAVFGLDKPLMALVDVFVSAAKKYGPERRIILLHGPVGTAKSTLVRLMKKGLEAYSQTDDGALYTFAFTGPDEYMDCPMHEEPLKLIPVNLRAEAIKQLGLPTNVIVGDLCPACQFVYDRLLQINDGNWVEAMKSVQVKRLVFNEKRRVGIGTFQPRDEKNQDSTELTGDINYRKIAIYGSDSDPRAFNFDGELNIANRGMVEFIEILKLDVAFLYDLLTASQEKKIKPKKFPHTDIDEVIISHTNEAEYRKLLANEYMEAFRDRTIRVDIPYNLRLSDEIRIYERDYSPEYVQGKHISPRTLEVAAMWAVLTRLEEPKRAGLSMIQKMKLYDGQALPGFTEDSVIELKSEHPKEGMSGISPRYIQDMLANALVSPESPDCVNVFIMLRELEHGLAHHSLIVDEKQRKKFNELLETVRAEYDEMLKNDIQRVIVADEDAVSRLCSNYIEHVSAYVQKQKVRDPITRKDVLPNEKLMREIEEKIEIPESRKDDFRREIMNYIGALAINGKKFTWESNPRLRRALELKLFEDQKDSIKFTAMLSEVTDKETQEKIEAVKARMVNNLGYCDCCATDVLNYAASIFARGDKK